MIHYIDNFPGQKVLLNGQQYLYFGGTAYLGLQTDKEFQSVFIENIRKYGTNYGASRNSNVRFSIYGQTEGYLANLVGSEACLTLSSGYLAGQLVSQHFNTPNYRLFYAPNTHAALQIVIAADASPDSLRPYPSFETLNSAVRQHLSMKNNTVPVVFLDSIDFSGRNYPDFQGLASFPLDKIVLVVDDSHGIGVIGPNGGGVYQKLKSLHPKELVICCSLGKGFGIQAGAVFGNKKRIDQLMNTDLFGGASPASPASMATLIESDGIYSKRRTVLRKNIRFFLDGLKPKESLLFMENHPAFFITNPKMIPYLEKRNILLSSFNYPSEDSNSISRIVISAYHSKKNISILIARVNEYDLSLKS